MLTCHKGKAYLPEQKDAVKALLEQGRDEEHIEKETGVSDRTIRRWKMELEKTGRIGKPPESRTGRHRVLNPEVEAVCPSRSHYLRAPGHPLTCDRRCSNIPKTSQTCR